MNMEKDELKKDLESKSKEELIEIILHLNEEIHDMKESIEEYFD